LAFDLLHVVRLPSLEFSHADVVPQEEKDKSKGVESQLKIQLFFFGRRVEKKALELMSQEEVKILPRSLGEQIFVRFKVSDEVFKNCHRLGLETGAICDWDAVPQPWASKNNKGEVSSGIWYLPAALLKLNGKDIDYQILQAQSNKPVKQDAFAFFGLSNNTHTNTGSNWDASLGNLEKEINAELEHA
jgi:hypothetical protein